MVGIVDGSVLVLETAKGLKESASRGFLVIADVIFLRTPRIWCIFQSRSSGLKERFILGRRHSFVNISKKAMIDTCLLLKNREPWMWKLFFKYLVGVIDLGLTDWYDSDEEYCGEVDWIILIWSVGIFRLDEVIVHNYDPIPLVHRKLEALKYKTSEKMHNDLCSSTYTGKFARSTLTER